MKYSTFLLDLDHTLLDSDTSEAKAFAATLEAAGIAHPERYSKTYRTINLELWAAVERGEISPQQVKVRRFERLVKQEGFDADPTQMAADFVAGLGEYGELYAGAREVLETLAASASLAMVTNGLSEVQRARIERLAIARYFDAIVISAEVGTAKPGTEIFELTFDALNSPARDSALMVGDSLTSDIRGGTNFGIATCWYNPHARSSQDSDQLSHEIVDICELLNFIGD